MLACERALLLGFCSRYWAVPPPLRSLRGKKRTCYNVSKLFISIAEIARNQISWDKKLNDRTKYVNLSQLNKRTNYVILIG